MNVARLPQEAEIASLPFVDQVCPHRKVATIVDQLPTEGDVLVHCKVSGDPVVPSFRKVECRCLTRRVGCFSLHQIKKILTRHLSHCRTSDRLGSDPPLSLL